MKVADSAGKVAESTGWRNARRSCIIVTVLLTACRSTPDTGANLTEVTSGGGLQIKDAIKLDLREISGLGLRNRGPGGFEVLAVSDTKPEIGWVKYDNHLNRTGEGVHNLKPLFNGGDGGQWEAIAIDGGGKIFILREHPGRIEVLSRDLNRRLATLKLDFESPLIPDPDENSLGEGLVLLKDGHLLVAREKNSPMLIEFGPRGASPAGVSASTFLPAGEEFSLPAPQGGPLEALATWAIGDTAATLLSDISEIAVGPDSVLYALSDESGTIARLEGKLRVDEDRFAVKKHWKLPDSVVHPEGLVFYGRHPLVASDKDSLHGKNVFVLDAIE